MPFRYVLDEHLRGALWHAIQHHNAGGVDPIELAAYTSDPAAVWDRIEYIP
jgi:hypothetical protein